MQIKVAYIRDKTHIARQHRAHARPYFKNLSWENSAVVIKNKSCMPSKQVRRLAHDFVMAFNGYIPFALHALCKAAEFAVDVTAPRVEAELRENHAFSLKRFSRVCVGNKQQG
jgi:hypothetical protein